MRCPMQSSRVWEMRLWVSCCLTCWNSQRCVKNLSQGTSHICLSVKSLYQDSAVLQLVSLARRTWELCSSVVTGDTTRLSWGKKICDKQVCQVLTALYSAANFKLVFCFTGIWRKSVCCFHVSSLYQILHCWRFWAKHLTRTPSRLTCSTSLTTSNVSASMKR